MRSLICLFLLLTATSIEARMYQWVNPTTGNSQMSGKAPSWYRGEFGGPRVLVFENNVLVDDTAVYVSEEQRLQFRNAALQIEPDQKDTLTSAQAVAAFEERVEALVESAEMEEYLKIPPQDLTENLSEENLAAKEDDTDQDNQKVKSDQKLVAKESSGERVDRLKLLISAWDKNRTEEAKSLLESTADQK